MTMRSRAQTIAIILSKYKKKQGGASFESRSGKPKKYVPYVANPDPINTPAQLAKRSFPLTAKDAGRLIVDNLRTQNERQSYLDNKPLDDATEAKRVAKNWSKELEGRMDVRPDFREAFIAGAAYNETSANYQAAIAKFGGNAIILATASPTDGSSKQAEFKGSTFVYQSADWNTPDDMARLIAKTDIPPSPRDASLADASPAGTIRHEYGHRMSQIFSRRSLHAYNDWSDNGKIGPEPLTHTQVFNDLLRKIDVRKEISFYANEKWASHTNNEEAFAEAFAIWSHPKLDRTVFSPGMNAIFDHFDKGILR